MVYVFVCISLCVCVHACIVCVCMCVVYACAFVCVHACMHGSRSPEESSRAPGAGVTDSRELANMQGTGSLGVELGPSAGAPCVCNP